MDTKVYSCAKAHFVKKGELPEDIWGWITGMFDDLHGTKSKSFIPSGYPLKSLAKENLKGSSKVGEMFKYETINGSEMYIEITKWEPFKTLVYTETYAPTSGAYVNHISTKAPPNIMKFTLSKHYEGTMVLIERVEIGLFSLKDRILNKLSGGFDANSCTGRLAFILTGSFPKGSRYIDNDYTIERDDSLKDLKAI